MTMPAKKTATTKKATTATKKATTATKKAPAKAAATTKKATATTKKATATTKKAPAVAATSSLEGLPAPAFSLAGDDGQTWSLAGLKGTPVVLYFYPKDSTPGCTVEACDFRDQLGRAKSKGAVVLGVSRDSIKSHEKFRAAQSLNFPLLSDPDLAAHSAYGAWGKKVMYGKEVEGTIRSTFLIDGKGIVRKAWTKVKVDGHVDAVMAALEAL
jgi:thioredoxin-dependent peroxiredoxin